MPPHARIDGAHRVWQVRMWDLHSSMALGVLRIHEAAVEGMLVVPESGWLVTCSTDNTVRSRVTGTRRPLVHDSMVSGTRVAGRGLHWAPGGSSACIPCE